MTTYIIIGVVVLLLLLLFFTGYLKAPPDTAYIISGLGRKRILIGKAGWRVPFFERVDKLSLRVMQVDVRTSEAVPTNEFINVTVDGVANVKVSSDPELLQLAAEALLGKRPEELVSLVTQVMEGNMREIVGSVGLKEMVQDRQGVARKITENVVPDMRKLGLEVVNFNIQNFKDGAGTIENMGIDNVEQIRKNAQIAKANAQRDIAIATSNAQQEANAVKEANRLNIPVFAMVDTCCDPTPIDYVIPANDDAVNSIECIVDILCKAIQEGLEERKLEKDKEAAATDENAVKPAASRKLRARKGGKPADEAAAEEPAETAEEAKAE